MMAQYQIIKHDELPGCVYYTIHEVFPDGSWLQKPSFRPGDCGSTPEVLLADLARALREASANPILVMSEIA